MRKLITILAILTATALPFALHAASPAATHEWVCQYVATNRVSISTNAQGNASWTQGEGRDQVTVTVEMPTAFAMVATNCDETAALWGLTNGSTLVYHRPLAVFAAPNARVWVNVEEDHSYNFVTIGANAMTSTTYSAETWLATDGTNRHAMVQTTYITASRANAITNGLIIVEE